MCLTPDPMMVKLMSRAKQCLKSCEKGKILNLGTDTRSTSISRSSGLLAGPVRSDKCIRPTTLSNFGACFQIVHCASYRLKCKTSVQGNMKNVFALRLITMKDWSSRLNSAGQFTLKQWTGLKWPGHGVLSSAIVTQGFQAWIGLV